MDSVLTLAYFSVLTGYKMTQNSCNIGMRCSIIARHDGMVIGKNSVIGANSLVNKDIPANAVAYGEPVKMVGERLVTKAFKISK